MAKANYFANLVLGAAIVGVVYLGICGAQAEPTDDSLNYVVRILWGAEQNLGGAGVYLGNGLVITAAHVAGPNTSGVRIGGLDVGAKLVKTGTFPLLDLSLVSMEQEKLPGSVRLRGCRSANNRRGSVRPLFLQLRKGST